MRNWPPICRLNAMAARVFVAVFAIALTGILTGFGAQAANAAPQFISSDTTFRPSCQGIKRPPKDIARYVEHAKACRDHPPANVSYLEQEAREMFARVNEVRERNGRPPLLWHQGAADTAKYHGLDMLRRQYFDHTSLEGLSAQARLRRIDRTLLHGFSGENLAYFKDGRPSSFNWREMQKGLEMSPGHRTTMVNEVYTHVGIAIVKLDGTYAAVQMYISHEGELQQPVPPVVTSNDPILLPLFVQAREVQGWKLVSNDGVDLARDKNLRVKAPRSIQSDAGLIVLGRESRWNSLLLHGPMVEIKPATR